MLQSPSGVRPEPVVHDITLNDALGEGASVHKVPFVMSHETLHFMYNKGPACFVKCVGDLDPG
eukprot:6432909-Alexandrium_andersonii.AAC.1